MKFEKYYEDFIKRLIEKIKESVDFDLNSFNSFEGALKDKMIKGYQEHGDKVFKKPLAEILEEISDEAKDFSGWILIALVIAQKSDQLSDELEEELYEIAVIGYSQWLRLDKILRKLKNNEYS